MCWQELKRYFWSYLNNFKKEYLKPGVIIRISVLIFLTILLHFAFPFEINEKDKHQKYDDPIKKSFGLLKGKINIDQMMKEKSFCPDGASILQRYRRECL